MPYKKTPMFRIIAGVTASSVLALSITTSALAFDSEYLGISGEEPTIGLSISVDLNFSNVTVAGFMQRSFGRMNGHSDHTPESLSYVDSRVSMTQIPLLTFGDEIKNPGILYSAGGSPFYRHVVNAAEGDDESQVKLWLYSLGAGVIMGGALAVRLVLSDPVTYADMLD